MARTFAVALAATLLLMSAWRPARAEVGRPAHPLIDEAIRALDRKADLRTLRRIQFKVRLLSRDIVEGEHPGEPYIATLSFGAMADDFAGGYRLIQTKDPDTGEVIVRELTRDAADQFDTLSHGKPAGRRVTLAPPGWMLGDPFRALLLADKAADLRREPDESLHGARQEVVSFTAQGVRAKILIDAATHLITATETRLGFTHATSSEIAYNAMGDVRERTEFQLWDDAGGLRYPTQWDTWRNDVPLRTLSVDGPPVLDAAWDPADALPAETLAQAARLAATDLNRIPLGTPIASAPDPHRGIEEIAPGVVQIPGSWFVTLVRQDDGVVIIDAPISSGYSAEAIAEAGRRFPGLPIKAVVTSTAFFWHVGGVREYVARRIPIYVRDVNEDTLRRIIDAPHSLAPDRLSRAPAKAILRPVSGRVEIGHGRNRVVVMPNARAVEPMLMTYIPDARILHTGEMIQPLGPGGAFLYPESLVEVRDSIAAAHLQVDRLIGMHMSPRPFSDLEAAIAKAGA
jgi:hypothetical protein